MGNSYLGGIPTNTESNNVTNETKSSSTPNFSLHAVDFLYKQYLNF